MASRRFEELYRVKARDDLGDPEFWNRRFNDIDLRVSQNEQALADLDAVADRVEGAALDRIDNVITPLAVEATNRLQTVAELLAATSTTEVTVGTGTKQFTVPATERNTFAPLPYLFIHATEDFDLNMTARRVSYDRETGELVVSAVRSSGEGTSDSWSITPIILDEDLETLRNEVQSNKDAAVSAKDTAVASAGAAATSASASNAAKEASQAALTDFLLRYRGSGASAPEDPLGGQLWFDTSAAPNSVMRVYNADTSLWEPAVLTSIGGIVEADFTVGVGGQSEFTVAGGFTNLDVYKNGALLKRTVDVTFDSPDFTLAVAASEGDVISARGYTANDATDYYTKDEANGRYYTQAEIDAQNLYFGGVLNGKQPASTILTALAGLGGDGTIPYFTGSSTMAGATLTAYGLGLLALANQAALTALIAQATTGVNGTVRKATTAQGRAGTGDRYLDAATLADLRVFSPEYNVDAGADIVWTHNLGVAAGRFEVYGVCKSPELDFDDEEWVLLPSIWASSARGVQLSRPDANTLRARIGNGGINVWRAGGVNSAVTPNKWRIRIVAYPF